MTVRPALTPATTRVRPPRRSTKVTDTLSTEDVFQTLTNLKTIICQQRHRSAAYSSRASGTGRGLSDRFIQQSLASAEHGIGVRCLPGLRRGGQYVIGCCLLCKVLTQLSVKGWTEQQMNRELNDGESPAVSSKRRTLEDLFRPPLDLMIRGTLESVTLVFIVDMKIIYI